VSGTIFTMNCCDTNMVVGSADGKMRFWRNTRVANLGTNQTTQVGTNVIGYEWDEDLDNGFRPGGEFRVSETAGSGDKLQDYGTNYGNGTATHAMTEYRAPSGALVFGAGSVQWSWGLDSHHDRGSAAADTAAQQATSSRTWASSPRHCSRGWSRRPLRRTRSSRPRPSARPRAARTSHSAPRSP
jgi:hypothetical protein